MSFLFLFFIENCLIVMGVGYVVTLSEDLPVVEKKKDQLG
jgi:hypothetical protein